MNSFNQITSFPLLLIHLGFLLLLLLISIIQCPLASHGCHEQERTALLNIKSSLEDPSHRLASWQDSVQHQNCCDWRGIGCSSESFHVISIDLRNIDLERHLYENASQSLSYNNPEPNTALRGNISHSLSNITHLEYLDLSFNDLRGSDITQFSYLTGLTHLDLSHSSISGSISTQFSNLSSLDYLGLSCVLQTDRESIFRTPCLELISIKWVRGLGNLQVLRLTGIDLSEPTSSQENFAEHISYLWNLRDLDVSYCNITGSGFPIHQFHNLSRLSSLKMNHNTIKSSIPLQLANLTSLSILSASGCSIQGYLPSSISDLKYLNFLDLSNNNIQGPMPKSICEAFSLQHLDLQSNNMTGTIPSCITKLRNLSFCDVSHNSFRGTVMLNELNLTSLDLSYNKLTVVIDQHQYPSPGFGLEFLRLRSCNLKGFIPAFICNFTLLKYLDLSYNNLTGAIPSCISKLQNLNHLDFSNNKLRGPLPLPPQAVDTFNLSHNKLNGEISMGAGERLSRASLVILNNNEISGSIPSSICSQKAGKLRTIDFSYNKLSGIIPSSIGYCNSLHNLNLGNNNLTGNIPNDLPFQLGHLQLNNNNLNGVLPESTVRLLSLTVLNLGNNNFEGVLPRGLGSLNSLAFISLRSNNFTGSIPEDIIQLNKLLILDLSMNNLSGPIPMKIGSWAKLTSMSTDNFIVESDVQFQLVIKGTSSQFDLLEGFISGIDLSCNILDGNIPEEIGLLQGLVMLNLSHNLFSGIIPASVGNMSGLESLDLSSNRLSGQIPQSLTSIDSLGVLNLSHNNLSGRIPRGNHFETLSLDGSAFAGNDLLCGFPTEKLCDDDDNISTGSTNPSSKADGKEKFLLYAIVAMGFTIGFWG